MKILMLAPHPFFQHRGTPIAVRMSLEVLTSAGHRLHVATYHEGEDPGIQGCELYRIAAPLGVRNVGPGFSLKKVVCDGMLFFKCLSLVRRNRYDLLHAVEESSFIAWFIKRFLGIPYIYDMDSSLAQQMVEKYSWLRPLRHVLEWFEGRAVRGSVGVVAVCKSLAETAGAYDAQKPILRLEDVSLIRLQDKAERTENSVGVPPPIVMYVGNLEPYQGIDLLIEGFALAVERGIEGHLVIIGGAESDIERYRSKCLSLRIANRVRFLGPRPVELLGAYLSQADVLVSPRTRGVNTPMKVYSYLDSGRPLLATRLPTHTQVLDDEISRLVEPDSESMAEGLVELLRDPELRAQLAENGKARVEREFTLEAFGRKLTDFYDEIGERLARGGDDEPSGSAGKRG